MASHKRKFLTRMSIFLYFFSLTNADQDYEMAKCIDDVKKYCKTRKNHPEAMVCVEALIESCPECDIPDGIFRDYYFTFHRLISIGDNMKSPLDFCDFIWHPSGYTKNFNEECKHVLSDITDTKEQGLYHVLYHTSVPMSMAEIFWDDITGSRSTRYRLLYLFHVLDNISADAVDKPWDYCKERCYPEFSGDFNWKPYLKDEEN